MHCPSCGMPMSLCDQCPEGSHWICDGPNAETDKTGCGEVVPVRVTPLIDVGRF